MKKFLFVCLLAFGLTSIAQAATPDVDATPLEEVAVEKTTALPAPPPPEEGDTVTITTPDGWTFVFVYEDGD